MRGPFFHISDRTSSKKRPPRGLSGKALCFRVPLFLFLTAALLLAALLTCPRPGQAEAPICMNDETGEKPPSAAFCPLPHHKKQATTREKNDTLLLLGRSSVLLGPDLPPQQQHMRSTWQAIMDQHKDDKVFGPEAALLPRPVAAQWKALSAKMPVLPPEARLRLINGFFNNTLPGETDASNYGQDEYWASPEEFLTKGSGDCEDYAIAKYLALRYFSWPEDEMWILFVNDHIYNTTHAVLLVRIKGRGFVLDNLSRPVYLLIPEKDYAQRATPLYALNRQGLRLFALPPERKKEKTP